MLSLCTARAPRPLSSPQDNRPFASPAQAAERQRLSPVGPPRRHAAI